MTPLPHPPQQRNAAHPGLEATNGPEFLWRVWHPSRHVSSGDQFRTYGPLTRFDPHPPGPPAEHADHVVWYGAQGFDVSALEVFNRGPTVAEICPEWRGSLVDVQPIRLFPLHDPTACSTVGATTDLGSQDLADYATTQAWGRFFDADPTLDALGYLACRAGHLGGVATALFRDDALDGVHAQHLLWDDALWPNVMAALDGADVAAVKIASDACGRCTAST